MYGPGELAVERISFEREMLGGARCDIWRNRQAATAAAGQSDSWRRIAANVPCRLRRPRSLREEAVADRSAAASEWEVLLPVETDAMAADRLVIGGIEYEITGTDSGRQDALCLTCLCVRVE